MRCRVTVLMQRAADAIHRAAAPHMPLTLQLQLLSVLQVWPPSHTQTLSILCSHLQLLPDAAAASAAVCASIVVACPQA